MNTKGFWMEDREETSSQQTDRELTTSSIGSVTIGYKKSSLRLQATQRA